MTGWIEVNYKDSPGLYYLGEDGAMVTGWAKASGIGPYNNSYSDGYYKNWWYTDINYTFDAWYQYSSTWANGKNWFYFDSSGKMVTGKKQIGGKWYTFNDNGVCTSGC
jgi:glucan-binding YG repeat protein